MCIRRNLRSCAPVAVLAPGGHAREHQPDRRVISQGSFTRYKLKSSTILDSIADVNDRQLPLSCRLSETISQVRANWEAVPAYRRITLAACLAFVIANMDKVNLSVAIIPMSEQFGWSPSVAGLVQSAFFYGFFVALIPGGYIAARHGGSKTLPVGLAVWSLATAAVPTAAFSIFTMCASRAVVGLGEAVAPTSIVDIVARVVPKEERATAIATAFAGVHVGSIVGLIASPLLIHLWGWESLFLSFGALGIVWYLWFDQLLTSIKLNSPDTLRSLYHQEEADAAATSKEVPYRAFIRSNAVQALMFTHFCNNWFHYTMLAWLPTYFSATLGVGLFQAAQTALIPPLAGIACSAVAGPLADSLISKGLPVQLVRRIMQSVAFLVPTAFLGATAALELLDPEAAGAMEAGQVAAVPLLATSFITGALGFNSFALAGLYCTHTDLSVKYAPALLGVTNAAGALPGIIGVAIVGILYDLTQSWGLSLLLPSAVLMTLGTTVYCTRGRNLPIDFDAADNSMFGWEQALHDVVQRTRDKLTQVVNLRFLQSDTVKVTVRDPRMWQQTAMGRSKRSPGRQTGI